MIYLALLFSLGIILYGAEIFTNSIEWLGKRLHLGEGTVGSILAAVGTALPETMISVLAIVFGNPKEAAHIGVGTILGAPLLLATLAMFFTGIAAKVYPFQGRRREYLHCHPSLVARDLHFFLLVFSVALAATFLPLHQFKSLIAFFLIIVYFFYVYRTIKSSKPQAGETQLTPLIFQRYSPDPPLEIILFQVTVALLAITVGAQFFVHAISAISALLHIPVFILAIVIAPLATELPEKFNSIVWIKQGKDTLALGNITGAMVFQSSVIPALGILLTPWQLSIPALVSGFLTLLAAGIIFYHVRFQQKLRPQTLINVGSLYLAFFIFILFLTLHPGLNNLLEPDLRNRFRASPPVKEETSTAIHPPFPNPQNSYTSGQLITVLVPGLSLADFPHCPNLRQLSRLGAVGLLNTQNEGPRKIYAAYLSIATGKKSSCTEEAALARQSNEKIQDLKAADFYRRYTGNTLPTKHDAIYLPYLPQLQNGNPPEIRAGLLGTLLEQHRIPLLLIGNQDLPEKMSRPAALLAMNEKGIVPHGIVDNLTYTVSPFAPTVYQTAYQFLYDQTIQFLQENKQGLILLDLGDLARLDMLTPALSPTVYEENRRKMLAEIDVFLGLLQQTFFTAKTAENPKNPALLILAPFPAKAEVTAGNTLAPVCYYHPGMPGSELLSSASTKRNGLLTNLDIAPTILTHWGIADPSLFSGSPFFTLSHPHPLEFLSQQLTHFQINHAQRPILIKGYVLFLIILVLSILFLLLHGKTATKLYQTLSTLLLALTSVPLLFLLLPLFPSSQLVPRIIALFGGIMLFYGLLQQKTASLFYVTALYLLTALAVCTDLLFNAPLMKSSILGYDPLSGARYYGIGNEYLGVLFGSSMVGLTLLLELVKEKRGERLLKRLIPFLGGCAVFLVFLVAAPQWGTNVGGAITFFLGYSFFFAFFFRRKFSLRLIMTAGITTVLFLLILFAWDLQRPVEAQSHIGQTARLIKNEGITSLLSIFTRKINMNLKLIHYSLWSRVFLAFFAALALIFRKPPGLLERLFRQYPYLQIGFYTGLIGSFIILAVNDSGIVAAGTSLLFVAPTLLYLVSYPR